MEEVQSKSDSDLIDELYKDLVKNTIALSLDACKSMATGCATVATLYGAVLALAKFQHALSPWELKTYVVLAPFVIFAISGFLFARAFLPCPRLSLLLAVAPEQQLSPLEHLIAREDQLRRGIVEGSWAFWIALAWAIAVIAFVRIP